ncbi:unnamed protein product [Moneuplotes crassus]|uniref:Uncharacterized protein n=1 Tax=Euplotes crassus TaxID=5936 RepID=A0AAD1UQV0_EUPCR|nr:unnamed protein product [Moneuplotes crassus]
MDIFQGFPLISSIDSTFSPKESRSKSSKVIPKPKFSYQEDQRIKRLLRNNAFLRGKNPNTIGQSQKLLKNVMKKSKRGINTQKIKTEPKARESRNFPLELAPNTEKIIEFNDFILELEQGHEEERKLFKSVKRNSKGNEIIFTKKKPMINKINKGNETPKVDTCDEDVSSFFQIDLPVSNFSPKGKKTPLSFGGSQKPKQGVSTAKEFYRTKRLVKEKLGVPDSSRNAHQSPVFTEKNYIDYARSIFNSSNLDKYEMMETYSKGSFSPPKFIKKRKIKLGSSQGNLHLMKYNRPKPNILSNNCKKCIKNYGPEAYCQCTRLGNKMNIIGHQIWKKSSNILTEKESVPYTISPNMVNQDVGINTGVSLNSEAFSIFKDY